MHVNLESGGIGDPCSGAVFFGVFFGGGASCLVLNFFFGATLSKTPPSPTPSLSHHIMRWFRPILSRSTPHLHATSTTPFLRITQSTKRPLATMAEPIAPSPDATTTDHPTTPKRVPIPPNGVDYRGKIVLAPMVRSGELPSRLTALHYGADLVWGTSRPPCPPPPPQTNPRLPP